MYQSLTFYLARRSLNFFVNFMHNHIYDLPWITDSWVIFGTFIVFLVIFHVWFVRLSPLSSIQWKQIDYIWLTVAFFGIVVSVSENRAMIADRILQSKASKHIDFALSQVIAAANSGTSGAVCRTFVTSPASPPPEVMAKTQQEFDAQCIWFKKLVEILKKQTKDSKSRIDVIQIAGPQPAGGSEGAYSWLEQSVAWYNEILEDIEKLEKAKDSSNIELLFRLFGPLLIAFALALRITKVAGEIALERARQSPKV